MLQQIKIDSPDLYFTDAKDGDASLLKSSGITVLQCENTQHALYRLAKQLSGKNVDTYVATIQGDWITDLPSVNRRIAKALLTVAMNANIRKHKTKELGLGVNQFLRTAIQDTILNHKEVAPSNVAPFFELAPLISSATLQNIIKWVYEIGLQNNFQIYLHVNDMREKVVSLALSSLPELFKGMNIKMVISPFSNAIIKPQDDVAMINIARIDEQQALERLALFFEYHKIKGSKKLFKQIIQQTKCHPTYLLRLAEKCVKRYATLEIVKEEWEEMVIDAGGRFEGKSYALTDNALKLLLGIAQNEHALVTSKQFAAGCGLAVGSIQRAREQLLKMRLITQDRNELQISDPALAEYIRLHTYQ